MHSFHRRRGDGDGRRRSRLGREGARFGSVNTIRVKAMSEPDSVEMASRRLAIALDALETAAELRLEAGRSEEALASQIQALGSDRAKLASELDRATARANGLETANREVAQRLTAAIDSVRGVLTNGAAHALKSVGE
jgi:hypothetical protein